MEVPATTERVPAHTDEEANLNILQRTEENISFYTSCGPAAIDRRLKELDSEWDIERYLEASASGFSLLGLALGALVNRKWFIFPGIVTGFLLVHAIQGWCPPVYVLRKWGVRTATEIDYERYALKAARGDFEGVSGTGKDQAVAAGTILQAVMK
jgi:hypothetical protein